MTAEPRWKQRFQNFERAFLLLQEALENDPGGLSDLEKEGVIQRFEYTFELAWNTLKDYMEYNGIVLDQLTPRPIIKAAFAAKIIEDGQTWTDMLEHRNLMSHTYDQEKFETVITAISEHYLGALNQVFMLLKEKSQET